MTDRVNVIGSMEQDNLIARVLPPAEVTGVSVAKLAAAATLKRGTVMTQEADGTLAVLGSTGASGDAAYILTDDVEVGTEENVSTTAYRTGCFNKGAVTVADGYTMTAADEDALRKYGIVFVDRML